MLSSDNLVSSHTLATRAEPVRIEDRADLFSHHGGGLLGEATGWSIAVVLVVVEVLGSTW